MFHIFSKKNTASSVPEQTARQYDFDDTQAIAEYFKKITGITFEKQQSILKSKLTSFCKQRQINSFSECLEKITHSKNLNQELIDYLTTNESYFYREFSQIQQLANQVEKKQGNIDILCAPCSTGEEPYTIAIALTESNIQMDRMNIIGIDINEQALRRARDGLYNERNISKMPTQMVKKYFTQQGNKYRLEEYIKELVSFKKINLFDDSILQLGKFDFILSRNLLIYFDKPTKNLASNILEKLLKQGAHPVFFGHADLY